MENTLIKLTLHDETKKRAHDSQIVRAKENLKLFEVCIDPNLEFLRRAQTSCSGIFAYVCTEKLAFVD